MSFGGLGEISESLKELPEKTDEIVGALERIETLLARLVELHEG